MLKINPYNFVYFGAKRNNKPPKDQLNLFESKDTFEPKAETQEHKSRTPKHKSESPEYVPETPKYKSETQAGKVMDYFGDQFKNISPTTKNFILSINTEKRKQRSEKIIDGLIELDNKPSDQITNLKEYNLKKSKEKFIKKTQNTCLEGKWDKLIKSERETIIDQALKEEGPQIEEALIEVLKSLEPSDTLKFAIMEGLTERKIPRDSKDRPRRKEKIANALADELIKKNTKNEFVNKSFSSIPIASALRNYLHNSATIALLKRYKEDEDGQFKKDINDVLDKRVERQYELDREYEELSLKAKETNQDNKQ